MPNPLCCTSPQRSDSPDLPNVRLAEALNSLSSIQDGAPRTPTTGTEDLRDLQRIFEEAGSAETSASLRFTAELNAQSTSTGLRTCQTESPTGFTGRLRKRLSRDVTKSNSSFLKKSADRNSKAIKGSKPAESSTFLVNSQATLLSERLREESCYDSDAEVLVTEDVLNRITSTPADGSESPSKNRQGSRRGRLQDIDWRESDFKIRPSSDNRQDSCAGLDQPPRVYSSPKQLMVEIGSRPNSPFDHSRSTPVFREPQWSRSESVVSPPSPVLLPMPRPSISTPITSSLWSLVDPKSSHGSPLVDKSNGHNEEHRNSGSPANHRVKECSQPINELSGVRSLFLKGEPHAPMNSPLAVGEERIDLLESSAEESNPPSAAPSVHLFSMRISQHLRSVSGQSAASSIQGTNAWQHTRARSSLSNVSRHRVKVNRRRQVSSSGFASTGVPVGWGTVVRDQASSVYSTRQNSPVADCSTSRLDTTLSVAQLRLPDTYTIPITDVMPVPGERNLQRSYSETKTSGVTDPFVETVRAKRSTNEAKVNEELGTTTHPDMPLPKISIPSNSSSTSLGKASKFKEELDMPTPRRQSSKVFSALKSLLPKAGKRETIGPIASYDGSADESRLHTRPRLRSVSTGQSDASTVMERALQANREEKSALFLSPDKSNISPHAPRERSSSFSRRPSMGGMPGALNAQGDFCLWLNKPTSTASTKLSAEEAARQHSFTFKPSQYSLRPSPTFVDPLDPGHSPHGRFDLRRSVTSLDPFDQSSTANATRRSSFGYPVQASSANRETLTGISNKASFETSRSSYSLGAWSRYPSHTREERTGSAGPADNVITRDFALEVNPAELADADEDGEPASPSKKKRKARSTTFGRNFENFLKNYVRLFGSQSAEFRMHGHGHRTSIAAGGKLEYPELEILPSVMPHAPVLEAAQGIEMDQLSRSPAKDEDGISRSPAEAQRPEFAPTPTINISSVDGTYEPRNPRMWSKLYESCVELPGTSSEEAPASSMMLSGLVVRTNSRLSKSHSLPCSLREHARKASVVSVGSLRASTVDLCRMLREAEVKERERLLRPASADDMRVV